MKTKNETKEELESTLRHINEIREEERVQMNSTREEECVRMAQNAIIILSDDESDSGRRLIPSKPVMSSNKASTFPAEHKYNNEETTTKKTHQGLFTPKQETLERIKRLHIKFGLLYTKHLFVHSKNQLEYLKYEEVDVEILENLYNANCMP